MADERASKESSPINKKDFDRSKQKRKNKKLMIIDEPAHQTIDQGTSPINITENTLIDTCLSRDNGDNFMNQK
jgi:hypothetical protein